MVLHDLVPRPGMNVFGIQIPITGSNTQRSLEHLLAQSDLAATRDAWLVEEELHPLRRELIALVHHPDYVERLMTGDEAGFLIDRKPTSAELEVMRAFELANADGSYHRFDPTTAEKTLFQLRDQSLRLAQGSIRGAELALDSEDRFCFYFGGGMHHGQHDFGEGFCLVNDLVIAVRAMQSQGRIRTAWIIDVDAHKGDGTAALTAEDDTIHTLSIHMAHGWPMDQPTTLADGRANPSFVPSDIDIPIASGEEDTYLPRLTEGIAELERRYPLPDFVVVVNGADPYERDQLPSAELLKMSREQLMERDRFVYRWIRDRDLPSLFVMAGNYGSNSWEVYSQFLERQIRGQLD
ncbi:MAG TPA: histone deacetylase [Alkalispirochaeta sp.]|nr:histone deacetylase [Alkalispirochaeta sp.]